MATNYENILKDLQKIKDNPLDFVKYYFVFGSVGRLLINENSDIDILMIGTEKKDINILTEIDKYFDDLRLNTEIDFKYYYIEDFKRLKENGNLFLYSINKDSCSIDNCIINIKDLLRRR